MWWKLQEDLTAEATKQVKDFERYAKRVHDENARRKRRSLASPSMLAIGRPATWSLDRGFDPFYVRARAESISHSVTDALRNGYYIPHRPAGFRVPKADGSQRLVSTFPIIDELISNRLYRSLLEKNRPRFSARSYAYRADLSAHDALMHVQYELAQEQRVFVAEYDFSKFFDRISHDHIWQTINEMDLIRTKLEERLLRVFLAAPVPYETRQQKLETVEPRTEGLPQGSSVTPPTQQRTFVHVTLRVGCAVVAAAAGWFPGRDAVADGEFLGSDEDVLDDGAQDALAVFGGGGGRVLPEPGEEPLEVAGEPEIGVAVGGLGVKGGDLVFEARLAGAQVRHAGAELVDGDELLGERGDHRGDRLAGLGQGLLELDAFAGDRVGGAGPLESVADLGADEGGVGE